MRTVSSGPAAPARNPNNSHHHLSAHEVVLLLETDVVKGLTYEQAARRLDRFGPNVLPKFRRHIVGVIVPLKGRKKKVRGGQ